MLKITIQISGVYIIVAFTIFLSFFINCKFPIDQWTACELSALPLRQQAAVCVVYSFK